MIPETGPECRDRERRGPSECLLGPQGLLVERQVLAEPTSDLVRTGPGSLPNQLHMNVPLDRFYLT